MKYEKNFVAVGFALLEAVLLKLYQQFNKQNKIKNDNYDNDMSRKERECYNDCVDNRQVANPSKVDESKPSTVAIIYQSEMDYISRCIHDYPNIETGGQLFGFITETGSAVVCYAIGPGRNANHQPTFFNQDAEYLQTVYNELNRRYGLRYIGEWHSHHQLGLARPSGHDASTIVHGIQKNNFRHFLLCIGNCDSNLHSTLNAFTFHINDPYHYNHAPWKIIKMQSPYRPIVDRELNDLICHPICQQASYGNNYILSDTGEQSMMTPSYSDDYWLNDKSNNLVLKNIIDYLSLYKGLNFKVMPQIDSNKHVHLNILSTNGSIHIEFGEKFPVEAPLICMTGLKLNNEVDWNYSNDIFDSFIKYFDDMYSFGHSAVEDSKVSEEDEIQSVLDNQSENQMDLNEENQLKN